ncbi:hypothetical protein [Candidatus Nitrospira inopinata]|nr:hypothetical protein [Candidatus Nitrospira inopinata]
MPPRRDRVGSDVAEHVDAMRAARENLRYFPGFALPKEGSLLKQ